MLSRALRIFAGCLLVLSLVGCEKHDEKPTLAQTPVKQEASQEGQLYNPAVSANPAPQVEPAATLATEPTENSAAEPANDMASNPQANERLQKGLSQIDAYLARPGLDENTKKSLQKVRDELQKRLR